LISEEKIFIRRLRRFSQIQYKKTQKNQPRTTRPKSNGKKNRPRNTRLPIRRAGTKDTKGKLKRQTMNYTRLRRGIRTTRTKEKKDHTGAHDWGSQLEILQ
jgi:hypothetical protein